MATESAEKLPALPPRLPSLAVLLSLLWPGLGQVYNGQVRRGAVLALLYAVSLLLIISAAPLGILTAVVLLVYAAANAYRVAERYERWVSGPQKRCPHCGESIQAAANFCRLCGRVWRGAREATVPDTAKQETEVAL